VKEIAFILALRALGKKLATIEPVGKRHRHEHVPLRHFAIHESEW
jgi:hypothetical protein